MTTQKANLALRGPLRLAALCAAIAVVFAMAFMAPPASADVEIESFETTSSDTQAGGHPDLSTSFSLKDPGNPEAARNVIFEAPKGVFGNPEATPRCVSVDFALQQCFSSSQVGLITIYANYENEPQLLLGTAPIYNLAVPSSQVATSPSGPDPQHPDHHPGQRPHRRGLRTPLHRVEHHATARRWRRPV